MLTKSSLLGALTLLSACSAVPHNVPKYIDLEHRPASIKSKYGLETITETDVSILLSRSIIHCSPSYLALLVWKLRYWRFEKPHSVD